MIRWDKISSGLSALGARLWRPRAKGQESLEPNVQSPEPSARCVLVALVMLCSTGCLVGSLHPVYDDNSIVFDEALLGAWEDREAQVSVTIARGEWRSYRIEFTDRFGTTTFVGHLTQLGTARLLNVLPEDGLEKPPFIVATNGFMQIGVDARGIRVREPDYTALRGRLKAQKLGLPAATDVKQNLLITAPTRTLRRWLASAVKNDALWADWKTFTRSSQ